MGMMLGFVFFGVVFYVARQWSKVRMKSLEVRALELEKGK
jgi:hypothetical protein